MPTAGAAILAGAAAATLVGEGAPVSFVELELRQVPRVEDGRVQGRADLVFALEVADPATAARVQAVMPRLSDRSLALLLGTASAEGAIGQDDVAFLPRQIEYAADEILGEGVVRRALVQEAHFF